MAGTTDTPAGPDTRSSAYQRMAPDWELIGHIRDGARCMRAAGRTYLPQYEGESDAEYERRRKKAPWRPEFVDALRTLASKPFGKEVSLQEGASDQVKTLSEDIDQRGNSLTAFSRHVFETAIANGFHGILVDYPTISPSATLADERSIGARPYWVSLPATSIIALYTAMIDGKETPVHVRIRECTVEPDGFGEREVERIRVFDRQRIETMDPATQVVSVTYGPATWMLFESQEVADANGKMQVQFVQVSSGLVNRGGKTDIPLKLFYTGERKGDGLVKPPLIDLANMQVELYQAMSREDEILDFAGSPMLSGNGFNPPGEGEATVQVGPKRVLWAPPGDGVQTSWSYIQPDAANLKEIRDKTASIIDDMRRLGMQPMTQQKSGNPTATGQSIEAAKAQSTVTAWALDFKDVLEQAFVFTTEWLGSPAEVEVSIDTDFNVLATDAAQLNSLEKARDRKDISHKTYLDEQKRRGILRADLDVEDEIEAVAEETAALEPEVSIDPVTGQPIEMPQQRAPMQ